MRARCNIRWLRWPVLSWRRASNVDDAVQGHMTGMLVRRRWRVPGHRRWTPAWCPAGVCSLRGAAGGALPVCFSSLFLAVSQRVQRGLDAEGQVKGSRRIVDRERGQQAAIQFLSG